MSYVARIADMRALLDSWADLLRDTEGSQVFSANERVFATLEDWPRIKWFYYCDDRNGNTIRLYDTEHFNHFGGGYYLEERGSGQEQFERVIIRGENMWGGEQVDGERPDSMKRRFREESAWELFRVARSPLRPGFQPPENLLTRHRVWADREGNRAINIQAGMNCPLRLWYFKHLNQVSAFDFSPPAFYPRRVVRPPTSATTIEALRRLTRRADRPTGDPGRPAGSESRRGDSMATATDGLQNALHITARVQSGNKIEITAPGLQEGQDVNVYLVPRPSETPSRRSVLEFLDSLPSGPRSAPTWDEVERRFQEERDAWDR